MSNLRHEKPDKCNVKKLKELMLRSDNCICADCGAQEPKWASTNIGVFVCLKCSIVHKRLGSHVSKVMLISVDEWSDDEIESMIEVGGNSCANKIYEAYLPNGISKPNPNSSSAELMKFIRSKYELQEFLKPSLRIVSSRSSFKACASGNNFSNVSYPVTSKQTMGTTEPIGILMVKVVKGTDLAIRDMLTSDPYVILTLGQQKVQTSVKKSNLNPVWNEELKLSVFQRYGALKLQVFDQDLFSADDIMGEAEIDLQPLITAATVYQNPELFGNMQVGRWLKSNDNALMKDSTVNIISGKIKQELLLKLQNVESGELELEMEWIPMQ